MSPRKSKFTKKIATKKPAPEQQLATLARAFGNAQWDVVDFLIHGPTIPLTDAEQSATFADGLKRHADEIAARFACIPFDYQWEVVDPGDYTDVRIGSHVTLKPGGSLYVQRRGRDWHAGSNFNRLGTGSVAGYLEAAIAEAEVFLAEPSGLGFAFRRVPSADPRFTPIGVHGCFVVDETDHEGGLRVIPEGEPLPKLWHERTRRDATTDALRAEAAAARERANRTTEGGLLPVLLGERWR